jgi:subtilisin family serine protease
MKNTCTFFILGIALLFPFSHFAQDFYYYKGDSVHLLTDSTLCAFSFFDPTQSFVLDSLEIEFQILDSNFYAVEAAERGLLDSLGLSQEHLCKRIGAHQVFIRNDIILKPLQTTTQAILDSLMNSYGLMLLEERHGMLRCASLDPVSQSSQLFESNYFEFCEPNIYQRIIPAQHIPDDPYFNRQWNFHQDANTVINDGITGLLDADIDLPEAWDLTTGSPNVVIAVLDFTGVSANHPDLPLDRQLRLPGSNFSYLQDGSSADDPSPNTIYSDYYIGHGDACAGILSGEMDNEMGIAGISSGCKIMPIRYGEVMSSWNANLSFIFPVDNGADIISCSFGFTASSEAIDLSLSYCFQNNVLVVFAAGNSANHQTGFDYTNVLYPANSDIQGVISVGASNYLDQQADYSPSSEFIDIVAPSAHDFQTSMNPQNNGVVYSQVEGEGPNIWTTDLPGDGGYNPWSSDQVGAIPQLNEQLPDDGIQSLDYTGRFFGTSAATPQVAGVAALMRSANSCLTNTEITQILYESADKIGDPTLYDNQGHCDEFGYGRLNAFQAVLMALDAGDIHFEVYYLCQDNATTKIWIGVEGDVNDYHFALNESTVEAQTEIDLALFTAPFYLKATKLNSGCTSMRRLFPEDHTHQVTMNTSTTMPVCSNPFGGAIDASASNLDQSATTLTWNMSDDDLSLSGLQSNNLEVGAYTIIVTNETGCSDIESVSLSTGIANCCDVIDVNIQDQTNNICPGLDDASLAIVAIGGSADYDAIWTSASNFQINNSILSPDFGVLNAGCGAYGLVIEDLYWGCQTGPQPFLIDCNTNEIIFTFDPIREASCELNCDGGTLVNISGGVAPYQYELNEESIADLITVNALCHGEHLLHITDVNGCTNELTINVGFEPYDYPTGHTYNGENWDGETIIVNGNLEIPAGLWPDMFDVEFIMTEGSEILVSTNAQIKWSEVDVTACGNQWNGISFSDFSIANINGAFSWDDGQCSLADKAISVEGTFEVPLTIHDMEIKGVNFMNNRRGLLVNNSGVALSSAFFGPIVFENCTFQINNDYFQHFTAVDAQVRMVNAKGYGFRSCAFLNNTDSPFWSDRGRAIDAYNSWFDVDDLDETGFDTNGSLFRGWNMGINALI